VLKTTPKPAVSVRIDILELTPCGAKRARSIFSEPVRRRSVQMSKTAADQFAEILAAAGTPRIYGIVGDSLSGPTDAIRRRSRLWQ
jgi:hypothetical protein